MTTTEIKKALYKEKPMAKMYQKLALSFKYNATLSNGVKLRFKVPNDEAKDFDASMPAQLLIRWLITD